MSEGSRWSDRTGADRATTSRRAGHNVSVPRGQDSTLDIPAVCGSFCQELEGGRRDWIKLGKNDFAQKQTVQLCTGLLSSSHMFITSSSMVTVCVRTRNWEPWKPQYYIWSCVYENNAKPRVFTVTAESGTPPDVLFFLAKFTHF